MSLDEAYALLHNAYLEDDPAEILAAEYAYLLAALTPITEWEARNSPDTRQPTILKRIATLLPDQLPDGAAPSLRDSLHALDLAFGEWQVESAAWQRWRARQMAVFTALLPSR